MRQVFLSDLSRLATVTYYFFKWHFGQTILWHKVRQDENCMKPNRTHSDCIHMTIAIDASWISYRKNIRHDMTKKKNKTGKAITPQEQQKLARSPLVANKNNQLLWVQSLLLFFMNWLNFLIFSLFNLSMTKWYNFYDILIINFDVKIWMTFESWLVYWQHNFVLLELIWYFIKTRTNLTALHIDTKDRELEYIPLNG